MTEWREVKQGELDSLVVALTPEASWEGPRHQFTLTLADIPFLPRLGFSYMEVDPERADRGALLELTLPADSEPSLLLRLAEGIAALGPLHSLVGGYVMRWSPLEQLLAFNQGYLWARRFLGFDLQVAEDTAWLAPTALPGTNWLTLVGPTVAQAAELDTAALLSRKWKHGVEVKQTPAGPLVQAGAAPTWGDLNAMDTAEAYAEVSRALEAALPEEPVKFWGAFHPDEGTERWMRRFLEPGEWAEPNRD